MNMEDLKRRALLGDQETQEECTRQGIIIPCWRCRGSAEVQRMNSEGKPIYAVACKRSYCGAYGGTCPTPQEAIAYWNRRPAPPIGRCKDCKHQGTGDSDICHSGMDEEFCSGFEPKED